MLEISNIVVPGFFLEICEMNGGEYYILEISACDTRDGVMIEEVTRPTGTERGFYRFHSKEGLREALSRFLAAAL